MAYKFKELFIFETGDEILSLVSGRRGRVLKAKALDIETETQFVDVIFPQGEMDNVDTQTIELVRKVSYFRT